jgi:uncharacterized protein YjiS (DUF1127 family)
MSCTSWTQAQPTGAPAGDGHRRLAPLAGRIGSLIAKVWRTYWDWRLRRTTVLILQSLDRRTLHDIGIDPSEIESLVCHAGRDRRRPDGASRFSHLGRI